MNFRLIGIKPLNGERCIIAEFDDCEDAQAFLVYKVEELTRELYNSILNTRHEERNNSQLLDVYAEAKEMASNTYFIETI